MTSTRECSLTKKCKSVLRCFENIVNMLFQTVAAHFGSLDYIRCNVRCPSERNGNDPTKHIPKALYIYIYILYIYKKQRSSILKQKTHLETYPEFGKRTPNTWNERLKCDLVSWANPLVYKKAILCKKSSPKKSSPKQSKFKSPGICITISSLFF